MLNKLRKIRTSYQLSRFFVAFEKPLADTFLLERNKLFFFDPKFQQNKKFCPIELSRSSAPLYHCLELSLQLQKSILLVEVLHQRGKIPCTWTWVQEFFQCFAEVKKYPSLQLLADLHLIQRNRKFDIVI